MKHPIVSVRQQGTIASRRQGDQHPTEGVNTCTQPDAEMSLATSRTVPDFGGPAAASVWCSTLRLARFRSKGGC
jgi:hypothetical protein